jgi:tricarballylate dehydrogenase
MTATPGSPASDSYSEAEYWSDLNQVTSGHTDEALARMMIRETASLRRWMEQRGVRFQPALTGTLNLSRTNAFFLGGGKALLNAYYVTAARLGVTIAYDTEVQDVCLDGSAVRELVVSHAGIRTAIRAKTVVAAAGGFQANLEWLKEYWGDAANNFLVRGTPYAKGRVLRSLLDQGVAAVGDPTQCHAVAIDARAPKFDGGIVTRLDCIPFSIVVDRNAERFYDEGQDLWPKRYAIWGRLVAQRPEQIAYAIFDSKAEDLFMPSVFRPIQGDTIADLARQLDLDVPRLEATVRAFNDSVRPGTFDSRTRDDCRTVDLDPPKSHWARALDTPPFSAYPLRPGITFTYLGVRVDERARVIMRDGAALPNLFAAGEIMSGNILGQGYLAGFGMAMGSVFGRIAGHEAAAYAHG